MNTLKDVLRIVANETPNSLRSLHVMDIDDKDGFGPIRTTAAQSPEVNQQNEGAASIRYITEVCMSFLAVVPILQSFSGEPTRDRDLTELVLGCAKLRPEKFLLVCPIFLDKIRQRTLNLTVNNLDKFLDEFAKLLQLYTYARSEQLQLLATHFLDSTLHIWLIQPVVASEVGDKVRQLYEWLSGTLRKQKIRAWKIRDSLARFFDRYLACDPSQVAWTVLDDDEDEQQKLERLNGLPSALLPMMSSDEDIRVRFRVAVVNARLFAYARRAQHPVLATYDAIKQWYTVDLDKCVFLIQHSLTSI
jgi:ataxia telangiectasia mutated family protein